LNNFKELGLSPDLVDKLATLGFINPTPIQSKAIPMLIENPETDFIGLAQTGTGKTAAFGLPLLESVDLSTDSIQALILAPTRELSQQIATQLNDFKDYKAGLHIEVVYGGAAITNQIKALKKRVQVLVATPGRLLDLVKRKAVDLGQVKTLVLDEADEMLNMGFKEDIDAILQKTHMESALWLYSATMPVEIQKIVKTYMSDPVEVSVNTEVQSNVDIEHRYVITKTANKIPALKRFLDIMPEMRGVMFCRTRWETQKIAEDLGALGYGVEALHGDLSQAQRDAVMRRFKERSMQLLIATDVAARGIDVSNLTHVIHHTLPDQLEYYTHRSGRTGRAGKKGISIAFINPRERRKIEELEKKLKIKFKLDEVPTADQIWYSKLNHWANLVVHSKVDDRVNDIIQHLEGQFSHLDNDELIRRLISTQVDHLLVDHGEEVDLNESVGKEKSAEVKSKEGYNKYFINIGTIDGLTKADLLHFLSEVSNISRKAFGELSIQKNFSFFEVRGDKDNKLEESFIGISVDGREIRVNLENSGVGKSPAKQSGRKPRSRGKGYPRSKRKSRRR
jgi:ATP-dependent RNA helicase DeaD